MPTKFERAAALAEQAMRDLDQERYEAAEQGYSQAIRVIERGPGRWASAMTRQTWAVARAGLHRALGRVAMSRGRPSAARVHQERALRDYQRLFPPSSREIADVNNDLAATLEAIGDIDGARHYLTEALAITTRIGDPPDQLAPILNNLAMAQDLAGDSAGALATYQRALALPRLNPLNRIQLEQNLAFHYSHADDDGVALPLMFRVLDEIRRMESSGELPVGSSHQSMCQSNIGAMYAGKLDLGRAVDHLEAALALMRLRSGQSIEAANTMAQLADCRYALGELNRAEALVDEAVAVYRAHGGGSYMFGRLLAKRSRLAIDRGDLPLALSLALEGCAVASGSVTANRSLIEAQLAAGTAYAMLGSAQEAEELLTTALHNVERISTRMAVAMELRAMLGILAEDAGDLELAISRYRAAIAVAEENRRRFGAEPSVEFLFGSASVAYHALIGALWKRSRPGDHAEAFLAAEAFRARSLGRLLLIRDALPDVPGDRARELMAADSALQRQLAGVYALLEGAGGPDLDPGLVQRRGQLEHQAEQVRLELAEAAPEYADLRNPQLSTVDEVRTALADGVAFVLYEMAADGVFVWVARRTRMVMRRLAVAAQHLDQLIQQMRVDCSVGAAPGEDKLRELSLHLIRPVTADIVDATELVLSPGGILTYLPFELLWGPAGRLGESHLVSYVPSATTLLRFGRARPARPDPGFEFVGFAVSAGVDGHRTGRNLPPLPGAEREVARIAALFGPAARTRMGAQATRAAVRDLAPRARFVHFAAHAFISDLEPRFSGIHLSRPAPGEPAADDPDPDLYVYEVAQLNLNADLVVLAACDTALGTVRPGEGMVGFSRALLAAGARAALVTLWPVPDAVAGRFMRAFYCHLLAGLAPAVALRTTKLELAAGPGRDLRSYGAFVLIGVGRP
jgi:CHAT domain-containing protein/Tfp pilus assembly protein PilF